MTDFFNEQWRSIPGFHGFSVSTSGKVKSEKRTIYNKGSNRFYEIPERMMKLRIRKGGYPGFGGSIAGKHFTMDVHRAMALAFFGPRPHGYEVRHLDGNPTNNILSNICYGTRSQNIADAKRHGTFPVLEKRPGAKLNRQQAIEIAMSFGKTDDIAKKYGVGRGVVRQIKTGETWESVTREARKIAPWKYLIIKFTEEQIKEICFSTEPLRAIARRLGLERSTIKRVRRQNPHFVRSI